jgi:outer membrane protein
VNPNKTSARRIPARGAKSLILGIVFALSASSASAAKTEIAYVNLQRAILEVNEGKRAKAKLQKTFEKKKVRIKAEEKKLLILRDEIKAQVAGAGQAAMKDEAMRKRAMDFERKRMMLQQGLMKEQQELQALEQKALLKITKKMRKVIQKIGKSGRYSLILELQDARMLYAKPHLDLTNEVIRKYNATHK